MKKKLMALVVVLAAAVPSASLWADCAPSKPPAVTVSGSGESSGKPDAARISIGVVAEGATAAEALQKNGAAMSRLIAALKKGIEDRDIQTSRFSITPRYRHDKSQQESPRIVGYQAANDVQVTVRNIDTLGRILDETVAAGANQIRGIRFEISESAKYLDEARQKAMADARHRASVYAKAAAVEIGKPILIEEQQRAIPYVAARMEAVTTSGGAAVPIESGELTFAVQVTVSYPIVGR